MSDPKRISPAIVAGGLGATIGFLLGGSSAATTIKSTLLNSVSTYAGNKCSLADTTVQAITVGDIVADGTCSVAITGSTAAKELSCIADLDAEIISKALVDANAEAKARGLSFLNKTSSAVETSLTTETMVDVSSSCSGASNSIQKIAVGDISCSNDADVTVTLIASTKNIECQLSTALKSLYESGVVTKATSDADGSLGGLLGDIFDGCGQILVVLFIIIGVVMIVYIWKGGNLQGGEENASSSLVVVGK